MAAAAPGQLNVDESPSWGSRSVDCFEKLDQIGEEFIRASVHGEGDGDAGDHRAQEDPHGQRARGLPYHDHPRDQNPQETAPPERHPAQGDRHLISLQGQRETSRGSQGTKVNIIVGSHVWAEDPEISWVDGEVVNINGEEAEIQAANGKKIVANLSKLYPKDMEATAGGVDDMAKVSYLHEPGVLQNLAIRYELNETYTYTGNILIAVNPFQRLPHIYDPHI